MIPKGWTLTSLGCVSSIVTKGATPTTYGYDFVEKSTEAVMFLGAYNCSSDGNFKSDSVKWISRDADDMLKRSRLMTGDGIFCIVGNTIGASFIVDKEILPANINQNVALIRPIKNIAHPKYMHYCLRSSYIQWQVKQEASTQAQPSLSLKQVGDFRITLPSIAEQLKITEIISTWDKAIATTEQLLANSQQQKKALMQKILTGRDRFTEFPEKWKRHELSDIAMVQIGSSPKSGAYNENGYGLPLIQGNADIKNRRSAPRIFTAEITKECDVGDILLSVRAPVGTVALSSHKACIGRGISAIRATVGFSQDFLYQWFLWFEPRWGALSQGSTFESINSDDIKQLKIELPDLEEQKKIASVLSNADQEIEVLQQKLHHLKQEKKALMQQLLTGKRRVNVEAV